VRTIIDEDVASRRGVQEVEQLPRIYRRILEILLPV